MALPKAHRLRRRRDFEVVYQRGLRRHGKHLTLRAMRPAVHLSTKSMQPLPPTLLGISVSTKVSKRAVVRNRIKRQLQAIFYQLMPQLAQGWQLIVVVKPEALACDYREFLQELKQLLADIEVFDGHS